MWKKKTKQQIHGSTLSSLPTSSLPPSVRPAGDRRSEKSTRDSRPHDKNRLIEFINSSQAKSSAHLSRCALPTSEILSAAVEKAATSRTARQSTATPSSITEVCVCVRACFEDCLKLPKLVKWFRSYVGNSTQSPLLFFVCKRTTKLFVEVKEFSPRNEAMASNKVLFLYGIVVLVFFRIFVVDAEGAGAEKKSEFCGCFFSSSLPFLGGIS